MTTTCRNCSKSRVNRPRGLCWTCYYTPGVKEFYPSTSKFARRGVDDFNGRAARPVQATDATPGSEAKITVLMERAAQRQSLWHPADAPMDPESQRRLCERLLELAS